MSFNISVLRCAWLANVFACAKTLTNHSSVTDIKHWRPSTDMRVPGLESSSRMMSLTRAVKDAALHSCDRGTRCLVPRPRVPRRPRAGGASSGSAEIDEAAPSCLFCARLPFPLPADDSATEIVALRMSSLQSTLNLHDANRVSFNPFHGRKCMAGEATQNILT